MAQTGKNTGTCPTPAPNLLTFEQMLSWGHPNKGIKFLQQTPFHRALLVINLSVDSTCINVIFRG